MTRTLPETIGPYRILGILGQGGMGVVYRCEHEQHGTKAALKTVTALNRHDLSGIRAEVQALKRIVHPGVVRILDEGVQGGIPWYAMEAPRGTNAQELAARHLARAAAHGKHRLDALRRGSHDPPELSGH